MNNHKGSGADVPRRRPVWRGLSPVRVIGVGVLIAAVWLIVDRYGPDWGQIIDHYFDTGIIAVLEITIAVLALDWLAEQRARRGYKRGIIQQMGSTVPGFALEAVRLANLEGWLEDGSLRAAGLLYANLQGARLGKANLQGAELTRAKFDGATVMPDGSAWNKGVDLTRYTNASHPLYWTQPEEEA